MIITCTACKTRFKVDEMKIPRERKQVKFKCSKCSNLFSIQQSEQTDRQLLEAILLELRNISQEIKLLSNKYNNLDSQQNEEKDLTSHLQKEEDISNGAGDITKWFSDKGVQLDSYQQPEKIEHGYNKIAKFLGEHYEHVIDLYEVMRKNISTGAATDFQITGTNPKEIGYLTGFCTLLQQNGILSAYTYNKKEKMISAKFSLNGTDTKFFTGGWFEKFIYLKIMTFLSQCGLSYRGLLNVQLTLPNGNKCELDVIFLIQGIPIWLECKTGNWTEYIGKYLEIRKILEIPKENAIFVVLNLAERISNDLTKFFEITLSNQKNVLKRVEKGIQTIIPAKMTTGGIWEKFVMQYQENDILQGAIINISDMGIFVACDSNMAIKGLIHKSNLDGDWATQFKIGDVIQVKIKSIKSEKQQIELVFAT